MNFDGPCLVLKVAVGSDQGISTTSVARAYKIATFVLFYYPSQWPRHIHCLGHIKIATFMLFSYLQYHLTVNVVLLLTRLIYSTSV